MGTTASKPKHHSYKLNLKRDYHSHEDQYHDFKFDKDIEIKDLTALFPPIYDQGALGSCSSNATMACMAFEAKRLDPSFDEPLSRLFHYYNERMIMNTINEDSGSTLRVAVKSAWTYGASSEFLCPYVISKFKERPSQEAYDKARYRMVIEYKRVIPTIDQMIGSIQAGVPFIFGIDVYESFMSDEVAKTGMVPMPKPGEKLLGGHAICACFVDTDAKLFKFRNSWGAWGADNSGYGYLSFDYMLTHAFDMWAIKAVSDGTAPVSNPPFNPKEQGDPDYPGDEANDSNDGSKKTDLKPSTV